MDFTSHSFPSKLNELIGQYGIARIPADRLEALGYRRITNLDDVVSLMSETEFQRLKRWAEYIMQRYHGYIFADYLVLLRLFVLGREKVSARELKAIESGAQAFRAAHIPRIFDPELYMSRKIDDSPVPDLFPTVDYIIQAVLGFPGVAQAAIAWKRSGKVGPQPSPIQATTVEQVIEFRKYAFTPEGNIDPLVLAEFSHYIRNRGIKSEEITEFVLRHDHAVFLSLEKMLGRLKVTPTYCEWNGDTSIVNGRFWFLRFSVDVRRAIAQAYLDSLQIAPTGKERKVFDRIQLLFPELCTEIVVKLGIRAKMEGDVDLERYTQQQLEKGSLKNLPFKMLTVEPWRSSYLPQAEEVFRQICLQAIEDNPEIVFDNVDNLFPSKIPVPRTLLNIPRIKEIFDEVRLVAVKKLSDHAFWRLFAQDVSGRRRAHSIGHTRFREESAIGIELRQYIQERVGRLTESRRTMIRKIRSLEK